MWCEIRQHAHNFGILLDVGGNYCELLTAERSQKMERPQFSNKKKVHLSEFQGL